MRNKIDQIAILVISILTILAISIGLVTPALFSTDLISFPLIIIICAAYAACMFILIGYLVKRIINKVKKADIEDSSIS